MKTITVRVEESLYDRIQTFVQHHGDLSHLLRQWIVRGVNESEKASKAKVKGS